MAHLSNTELVGIIVEAKERVQVGDQYYHYRSPDHVYTVIAVALDEETHVPLVVYQSSKNLELVWVRTLEVWLSTAETDDGQTVSRFSKVK